MAHYITNLTQSQIQLWDREYVLIWDSDPTGRNTPKDGYLNLSMDGMQGELIWWWRDLWKIKTPPKTMVFLWCVLENNIPIWDNIQKIRFQGPG